MLNNFVNFCFLFTKLSENDPCEKRNNIPGGHAWRHFFITCSKLEAMAIYLVKQACGNDILEFVYVQYILHSDIQKLNIENKPIMKHQLSS